MAFRATKKAHVFLISVSLILLKCSTCGFEWSQNRFLPFGIYKTILKKSAPKTRKTPMKSEFLAWHLFCYPFMAEMERFELSNSFPSYTISNRAPSTGLGDISVRLLTLFYSDKIYYNRYNLKNQVFFSFFLKTRKNFVKIGTVIVC